jgi:hypothetical protein
VAHTPEKARPLTSKLKRIYAPRLISDHIMVQEDFERLHRFLLETEGLSEVSDDKCGSWSRTNGRSWCINCRQRCLLGGDKDRADDCSPNCC